MDKEILQLSKFVEESEAHLGEIINQLKWSNEFLNSFQKENLKVCVIDKNHWIPAPSLDKHVKYCSLKKEGIDPKKNIELPSSKPGYENCIGVVSLEPVLENIPKKPVDPSWGLYFPEQGMITPSPQIPSETKENEKKILSQIFTPTPLDWMQDVLISEETDEDKNSIIDESATPVLLPYKRLKKYIFFWTKIPAPFKRLNLIPFMDKQKMMEILHKHIFHFTTVFEGTDAMEYLYAIFTQNSADQIVFLLKDKIGEKTPQFVLETWKHLTLELLEVRHRHLVATGQVSVSSADEDDHDFNLTGITSETWKGKEKMTTRERLDQYLMDAVVAEKIRKIRPPLPSLSVESSYLKSTSIHPRPKSHMEILEEQRNLKRRRKKYRAQNVHITKRSPTMVARTIITERMIEIGRELGIKIPGYEDEMEFSEEEHYEVDEGRSDKKRSFQEGRERGAYQERRGREANRQQNDSRSYQSPHHTSETKQRNQRNNYPNYPSQPRDRY